MKRYIDISNFTTEEICDELNRRCAKVQAEKADLEDEIEELRGKTTNWLKVFPRENELSMKYEKELNDMIYAYVKEHSIHYSITGYEYV